MRRPRPMIPLLAATAALAVGCAGMDDTGMRDGGMDGGGMDGDGGALGGSASTETLAETTLEDLPDGPLAWTGFEVAAVDHTHAGAFVHAREDTTLTVDGEEQELVAGEARWLSPDVPHAHGTGTAWDVLLAPPDAPAPDGTDGDALFTSAPLEGLPEPPVALIAILVELPPGTSTSVHAHPGPEFIHVTRGSFTYENDEIGAVEATEGDGHAIGRGVAVQKRNPEDGEAAAFLSWFVVDPDEPFVSEASFDG